MKRPARPVDRREEQQSGGGDDPDRDEPPTRRQRVARAVVQLRALVAMTGKTESTQCWGCNVAYDGGGFCDELQEQCVQDDVRLASYAAELARTVGTANARDAYDVVSGPSLDHRDDVEQLMGHQAVAYVTKILDTNEAILTESGRRESLKEYFVLRDKAVQSPVELDSIESDALVAKSKLILSEVNRKQRRSNQSTAGRDGKRAVMTCCLRLHRQPKRASYPRDRRRTDE